MDKKALDITGFTEFCSFDPCSKKIWKDEVGERPAEFKSWARLGDNFFKQPLARLVLALAALIKPPKLTHQTKYFTSTVRVFSDN